MHEEMTSMLAYHENVDEENREEPSLSRSTTFRQRYLAFTLGQGHHSLRGVLTVLIPSFIRDRFLPKNESKTQPTVWLDGLRGWAAFVVFFHHTHYLLLDSKDRWGLRSDERQWSRLPIVHIIFLGHTAISVFSS